jgi:2-keto-4-pentenoate hydratase
MEMRHLSTARERRDSSLKIAHLTVPQAYLVQEGLVAARLSHGAKIVGWKVGCTSPAIQQQFGFSQPISGKLLEPDIFSSGVQLSAARFLDCAVEPELVFRLGKDLEADPDDRQVVRSIDAVAAGIELHNYRFWFGAPTVQELIAANGIHAGLVVSEFHPMPANWDLASEQVAIVVNGQLKASGRCGEVMGSPLRSVQWLARHAAGRGQRLRAGDLVIPGSAVELVPVEPSDRIESRFATVGSCQARLV